MTPRPLPARLDLQQAPDEVLADRAADGDRRAFAVLVTRYGRLLRGYATRVLGGDASSDDVVQEALITAWQQLDSLHDRSAVRAWLIRITTRKALDHATGRRPTGSIDDLDEGSWATDEDSGPGRLAEAASLEAALARALDALPDVQRRAWTLRELGGYSYDEIAHELDLPLSTVRGALARARRTLVSELDGWR